MKIPELICNEIRFILLKIIAGDYLCPIILLKNILRDGVTV
ncbi:MAG: hypothetical protein WBM02_03825 [bacterium]